MNRNQLIAIALVGLLVAPGTAAAVVRGSPELSVFTPDNSVSPGEQTTLNVQIQNTGDVDVAGANPSLTSQVTTARGVTASLDADGTPIEIDTGQTAVGTIQDGQIQTAGFAITVPEGVEEGTYELEMEVDYSYTSQIAETTQAYQNREASETYTVEVRVEDQARFRVVDSSSNVLVGDEGTVTLDVRNIGSQPARDATVNLRSSTADIRFGESASASRFVGNWDAGETKTVEFDATATNSAATSSYSLTSTVQFEDTDGVPARSNNLSVGVTPRGEQSFSLSNVSSDLRVGEEGTVSGTITNQGPQVAQNAVVTVQTNSGTLSSQESEYAIGTLQPNQSAEFEFTVDVSESADPGARQLTHAVEFQNGDGDDRTSKSLNSRVQINESRDRFSVSVDDTLEVPIGNSEVVAVNVTNNGEEPLTDVSAKAYVNSPLSLDDDEAFLGRLAPGETKTVRVSASVAGSAINKTYPMSMDFQYERPNGDTEISETYKVPVSAVEPEDSGLPITGIALGIVALLVIGGVVLYRRRQ
ncbi:COG1361 S-layer family protein [Halogeometricum luteum]|uniref:COG1361 S-layer family protein n=1 Tax=Halogeometricum luteum TaxID=2950537 RepID=A0ABU2G2Z4_9EURY|nr:COG1361 S-layer family protein [Halogeometricum sp. S3BR5-2]MDS0295156.1 COG1361 S-layer family protein [Halogeometricum sp. S3BR5-2]